MAAVLVVVIAGIGHTAALRRRARTREAWTVAVLWAIASTLTFAAAMHLPSGPLRALLLMLFGGLSNLLKSF